MAESTLDTADKARLAHRVLRLREAGYDSERKVKALVDSIPDVQALLVEPAEGETQRVGEVAGPSPHALLAFEVTKLLDADLPGPTNVKAVERQFGFADLDSNWKAWDDAVTANLETLLNDAELKAWRASVEADRKATEEAWAKAGFDVNDVHPYFGHGRHKLGAANAFYDNGREGFAAAEIDWDTAVIKHALVDSAAYTVNLASHKFMSSVASVIATSAALASKTLTAGVLDAADSGYTAVTGAQSEGIIIYQSSAVGGGADVAAGSQRLIGYIDTATGLPVTPNGGNIDVVWDSGSNRIAKL